MALSRTMAQKDIDTFLAEIGAADNNFTVATYRHRQRDELSAGQYHARSEIAWGG